VGRHLLPTAAGAQGEYAITTSADDPSCVNPFTGTAEYTDLAEFGIPANSGVVGDGVAFTAFADKSFGFYGTQYRGLGFSDDGFLMYDGPANYRGDPATPQTLPDAAVPNNVAAMLWQDMQITYDENKRLSNIEKHGYDFAELDLEFFASSMVTPSV
jgi:hypothetical protein